jgi:hypothetical protein
MLFESHGLRNRSDLAHDVKTVELFAICRVLPEASEVHQDELQQSR